MRNRQRIAAGILIGLVTVGTASARELLVTGSGFVELNLPGYAARSSFSYAGTIAPGLLPDDIGIGVDFTVNGVDSFVFGQGVLSKGGELASFEAFGPFDWTLTSVTGGMAFRANGVSCGFPEDVDMPECAGNHRWGWESAAEVFVPEPPALGLAALGLLVLGASTSRRPTRRPGRLLARACRMVPSGCGRPRGPSA